MNGETDIIRIFIVAASPITHAGLESVLQARDEFVITGGAAEISAAPAGFPIGQAVDVILVNVEREKDFAELFAFLDNRYGEEIGFPSVVALFPPELQNSEYFIRALQSGVRGVLPNDASADEITASVAAAATGLISFTPEMLENVLSFSDAAEASDLMPAGNSQILPDEIIETLTAREREVLELLVEGESNKAIAYQLNISEHTVKFHIASIFGKLGVNTRTEAVTQALRRGLILL